LQSLAAHPTGRAVFEPQRRRSLGRPQRRARPSKVAWRAWSLRAVTVITFAAISAGVLRYDLHPADVLKAGNALSVSAGLGINQVVISGFKNTLGDDITQALQLEQSGSILAYDTAAARRRLENLAWVESADVSRSLPDGLTVKIRERKPYAVWQHRQMMFLIDAEGRTLEPASRADHKDLPLVVGEGASDSARDLMAELARHPDIKARLEVAVRVADRRWDLTLTDAPTLMLPADGMASALTAVDALQHEARILERRVNAIDLRVAGRVVFVPMAERSQTHGKVVNSHSGGV
jgi:cell division protein FtsQ